MLKPTYVIPSLPPAVELETIPVLKALATANRADFEAKHADLLAWLRAAVAGREQDEGFLPDMLRTANTRASWSEAQVTAIAKVKASREAVAAKRAASTHVGTVGQRLTFDVTVEHVATFDRPSFSASWLSETVYIVTMRDTVGNALVVKSPSFYAPKGEALKIKGTVKEHTAYREEAQTVLFRVAVL